jgi:hypothetical protein
VLLLLLLQATPQSQLAPAAQAVAAAAAATVEAQLCQQLVLRDEPVAISIKLLKHLWQEGRQGVDRRVWACAAVTPSVASCCVRCV